MKTITLTVGYTEKRSINYQSFEFSETRTAELEDGDDPDACFRELRSACYADAHRSVEQAVTAFRAGRDTER